MVPERWVETDTSDGSSSSRTKGTPGTARFNGDQWGTTCSGKDVGEDTTKILVADDEDGGRKESSVVLSAGKGSELRFRLRLIQGSDSVRWQWTFWVL